MNAWIKERYTIGQHFPFQIHGVDLVKKEVLADQEVKVTMTLEKPLKDQFIIHLFSNGEMWIRYGNERSLNYALHAIEEDKERLSCGVFEGGPDFEIRGIIEGFYGNPWPHQDRLDVIKFIHDYRMNSYFYAPKDDPYHRQLWREPYPEIELKRFLELVHYAKENLVDFYFCISPGNDFIYTKEEEFDVLFRKIDHLIGYGVTQFSLLMDDIDYVLKGDSLDRFQRPGVAHAYISNRLNRYLASKLEAYDFVMCPTEYWQNWDTEYRKDLREGLDPNTVVFWTGYNTVAEYIPNEDGEKAKAIFGHPMLLWDNYPVNDMAKDHLFMGPLVNRGKKLFESHVGMLSNPMISWHLSKIPVITMADYMWDSMSYDPELSYKEAIKDLCFGDQEFEKALKMFADENRNSLIAYDVKQDLDRMIETFDLKGLSRYFNEMKKAVLTIMNSSTNPGITKDALPWLNRFLEDFKVWNKVKKGTMKPTDITYIENAEYTLGYQVLAKVLKRMDIYQGKIYKKERPNFWDNAKVIKK
jgi:hyaluronoglucosaminidase